MSNYRITFHRNNLISCIETDQKLQDDERCYYFNDANSHIICVLIHAPDKEEAINEAETIVGKFKTESGTSWPTFGL